MLFAAAGVGLIGCTKVAELAVPEGDSAASYVDSKAGQCSDLPRVKPLVVDWPGDERSDLAEIVSRSIAVVRYDCDKLEVLTDCRVDGGYRFIPTAVDEYALALKNKAEIRANLPVSGVRIAGQIGQGEQINIGFVSVGKHSSGVGQVGPDLLVGGAGCEGATHFVRGVYRGAFAVSQGASAGAKVSAQSIFEASARGSRLEFRGAGKQEACKTDLEALSPPGDCGVPLRLELKRIVGKARVADGNVLEKVDAAGCPPGLVEQGGRCVLADRVVDGYACDPRDPTECKEQCDVGNLASCARYGVMQRYGEYGVAKDVRSARRHYEKGCEAKVLFACAQLGAMYGRGEAGLQKSEQRQVELAQFACDNGETSGCTVLGLAYLVGGTGVPRDYGRALSLFERACEAGSLSGCVHVGNTYFDGTGVPQDRARAIEIYARACEGDEAWGCHRLGISYREAGPLQDMARATKWYEKACSGGYATGCLSLGYLYFHGQEVPQDKVRAASLLEKACEGRVANGCESLGHMYESGDGVPQDKSRAASLYKKACKCGNKRNC